MPVEYKPKISCGHFVIDFICKWRNVSIQSINKRMVRLQKLIENVFLTLLVLLR